MAALPQKQREKQADTDDIERALRRLQQRSRQIARQFERRIEGGREQWNAGIDLRQQPDAEQRETQVAAPAVEKDAITPLRNAAPQPRRAIERERAGPAQRCPEAVAD